MRRHGAETILTFVALKITENLLNRFLDDIRFYDLIKKELIEISSPTEAGKEINISTIKNERGVRFKFIGKTNEELSGLLDNSKAIIKDKLARPFEPHDELIIYTIQKIDDSIKIVKINKKFGSGGYFDKKA